MYRLAQISVDIGDIVKTSDRVTPAVNRPLATHYSLARVASNLPPCITPAIARGDQPVHSNNLPNQSQP